MSTEDRKIILNEVEHCICHDRNNSYGAPEYSFARIAALWSVYTGLDLEPYEVADMLELMKIARRIDTPFHLDSYIDSAGYAVIAGELAKNEADMKAKEEEA